MNVQVSSWSDKWVDKGQIHKSSLAFDYAGKPCKNEIRISNESQVYFRTCFQALKMLNVDIHLI